MGQARSGSPQCDPRHAARLPYDERGNIARDASGDRRVQRAARRLLQEHVREASGPADEVAELAQLVLGRVHRRVRLPRGRRRDCQLLLRVPEAGEVNFSLTLGVLQKQHCSGLSRSSRSFTKRRTDCSRKKVSQ